MSTEVMDRLRRINPHNANDVPPLTPEREAMLMVAANTEFSGPLRRSWLVAAAAGLVLGIGIMAIWFSGGSNSPVTTGENTVTTGESAPPSDEQIATAEVVPPTDGLPAEPGPIGQITPIDIQCSTQLNDTNLGCSNLIDGTADYWNDLSLRGVGAVITVTFARPVQLEQVQFLNIENNVSFLRNYRVRGVEIVVDDLPGLPFIGEIPNDNDRPHAITTPTLSTTQLIIRITATWPSEAIDGRAFDELALDEIAFWGRIVDTTQVPEADGTSPSTAPPTTLAPETIFEAGWLGDHVYLAGYEALIVKGVGEACVAVLTGAEFRSDGLAQPRCTVQSGPDVSALAFNGFGDSLDTVFAGFVPRNADIVIQLNDETFTPVRTGQVWLFVIHNPDFAESVIADGHFVVTLNNVTIADITIDGIQVYP